MSEPKYRIVSQYSGRLERVQYWAEMKGMFCWNPVQNTQADTPELVKERLDKIILIQKAEKKVVEYL
jgi:hypothetical protein